MPSIKPLSVLAFAAGLVAAVLPAIAHASDSFGAIAYSRETGSLGWSYDHPSRRAAERTAMNNCGESDCEVLWFKNACGAIAAGPDGWGSGWGNNRRRAEREAVNSCASYSDDCSVIRWQCSGAR
ncbi:DUF4189 domain-containing protein [Rhizobium sp. YJ-22]|uniref:DUF4189 domain-containing protein n=1 Tax=Rhizobium sp. YJ-22 TaxID=3037556 RepID=UPI002412826A|nr:DUF4189 domain-containing protein [Rhizobium sp. YJ-22]MDG3575821.1 DUF4189 domain-containing protein [Rhizobium sp. YJ-22]